MGAHIRVEAIARRSAVALALLASTLIASNIDPLGATYIGCFNDDVGNRFV